MAVRTRMMGKNPEKLGKFKIYLKGRTDIKKYVDILDVRNKRRNKMVSVQVFSLVSYKTGQNEGKNRSRQISSKREVKQTDLEHLYGYEKI